MLKRGLMLIGDVQYDLYELKTKTFYRFDIVKKSGEFHHDVDSVLFSYYKKKRRRWYGDMVLYKKYIDTVVFTKEMQGEVISEGRWKKEVVRYALHEQWIKELPCPVLRIDGTTDYKQTAIDIANRYRSS